jgi:hypothetical protein
VLAIKTSAWEAAATWDSANLHIKDAEDQVALKEREALECVSRVETENSAALSFAHADAEGLARKIVLLEDELAEEHWAWETSDREHRECFEELALLQTQGSELCLDIVGPPRARHLSEEMRLAALRHTKMAGELATFWAAVSTTAELVLRRSPSNFARAEVVG